MIRPTQGRAAAGILIVYLLYVVIHLTACRRSHDNVRETWPVMGTFASLTLPSGDADQLKTCSALARTTFGQVNDELSIYRPDTPLSRLSDLSGQSAVAMSDSSMCMMELALHYARLSGGTFDPTVAPLVRMWGFSGGSAPTRLPSPGAIAAALAKTGTEHLILDRQAGTALLNRQGMQLDLGGIAKGYAVDLAYDSIGKTGTSAAMIDLGGNIRCIGTPRHGQTWRIGVRDPFNRERIIGALQLHPGMAVATSGHYERFILIDGRRYSHIIDPRTGRPVQGMAGVTVISKTGVESDALSTAFFVSGIKGTRALLKLTPDSEVLLIPDQQPLRVYVSAGMKTIFTPGAELRESVFDL